MASCSAVIEPSSTPDVSELLRVHMEASKRLRELIQESERLRDAGRLRDARRVFQKAEDIRAGIEALERQCRPKSP